MDQTFNGKGQWWRLPQNTIYDEDTLHLNSPDGLHWYWAPARDMPLADYEAALKKMNDLFNPVL